MPPVPWRELVKQNARCAAAATSEQPDDNAKAVTFTGKLPGWVEPLSNTGSPNMPVWEEVHDDGLISSPKHLPRPLRIEKQRIWGWRIKEQLIGEQPGGRVLNRCENLLYNFVLACSYAQSSSPSPVVPKTLQRR